MQFRIVLLSVVILASLFSLAQESVPKPAQTSGAIDLQALIENHFGGGFKVDKKFAVLQSDLDGDGSEDLVVVTFGSNPLGNSIEKNFKVIDPYDSYYGFGDPRVTTKFSDFGDGTSHCVIIIHNWQSATPKAKFVMVNLPFEKLGLGQFVHKKKTVRGISSQEGGGLNAIVFWDGKKYRWEPTDFSSDTDQLNFGNK